jgi:3-methyl-2-oxobutanoate hydroxymethyltransferase
MKKTQTDFLTKKQTHQKIVALTCYDYPTAVLEEQAGIDILFVGDSVGTNVLGYASETEVTIEDITHHLKAVRRGASQSYVLADLPYASYETPDQALKNAQQLVTFGADIVKLEGVRAETVSHLVEHGIAVCGHIGLQPQTQEMKVLQGKSFAQAKELLQQALRLEKAGISMLVLELVPEEVGKLITESVNVPTIGIGAGRFTDGQVLIVNDILGITPRQLKLAKRYQDYRTLTLQSIHQYKKEVEHPSFPGEENVRHMAADELQPLLEWVQRELNKLK